MTINEIPPPIILNCWKHHLGFLREMAKQNFTSSRLSEYLKPIGENTVDLYTGLLSPEQVSTEIIKALAYLRALSEEEFANWIAIGPKRFQEIKLHDGSNWTILPGNQKGRYIHIHPSRYSAYTIRVKAQSIKTAFILARNYKGIPLGQIPLESINNIRQNVLDLSPIKSVGLSSGIKTVYLLLCHAPDYRQS